MKKIARLFLSLLFIVALPIGFAFGDGEIIYNSDGVKGTRVSVEHQKGKLAGGCDGRSKNDSCQVSHAINSVCEVMGKNDELSCVARECEPNYLVHLGYGNCKTLKEAEGFCKKKKCENGKAPVPDIIANPNKDKFGKLRSGKAFRDCFCQIEKPIEYSCGTGQGTPPTNTGKFTNLDTITIAENTCSKSAAVFTGWNCDGAIKQAGDTISIEDKATCTAQWQDCAACNPGKGCGCSVSVKDNKCVYTTSIDKGYALVSGKDGANPQCVLVDEKECTDAGGEWKNGSCKCKSDVAGTHFDIKNKQCVCDDVTKVLENGKCVVPTKCPAGAIGGTYPKCVCEPSKKYVEKSNTCEPICNERIAFFQKGVCKCTEGDKNYIEDSSGDVSKAKCECPADKPSFHNGQCKPLPTVAEEPKPEPTPAPEPAPKAEEPVVEEEAVPEKCPNGASGTHPKCICSDGKEYVDNMCKCPAGQTENAGKCEGTPAVDENPDEKNCKKAKDTKWTGTECVCKDPDLVFENGVCKRSDADRKKALEEKQKAYDEAKANEQSLENRMLTATAVAASGIGGMELAMGLSQQKADKEADASMDAYISTMRCTYADKSVKAGPEEIELPGGNSTELMNLRSEYFALAADLKARKEALGMKPGIESEEILDKSQMGLYDEEFVGITSGSYESLYRAKVLGSETDQAKIDEQKDAAKKRVIGGAVAAGAGVVVGAVGNSLINGKLGEKIKANKEKRKAQTSASIDRNEVIKTLSDEELEAIREKYNLNTAD